MMDEVRFTLNGLSMRQGHTPLKTAIRFQSVPNMFIVSCRKKEDAIEHTSGLSVLQASQFLFFFLPLLEKSL